MEAEREIIFHGRYFLDFYIELTDNVKEKIGYVFRVIKTVEIVPEKFLKHIVGTDGLFEIRVESGSSFYRIFCCFDKGNIVVLFNAFIKKSRKTPKKEIEWAEKLKKEYFDSKKRNHG